MAIAATPTYFREQLGGQGAAVVDGGLRANNPMGLSIVEAIEVLVSDGYEIDLLSVGCTTSAGDAMPQQGIARGACSISRTFSI